MCVGEVIRSDDLCMLSRLETGTIRHTDHGASYGTQIASIHSEYAK
jgi:hypothetical protein